MFSYQLSGAFFFFPRADLIFKSRNSFCRRKLVTDEEVEEDKRTQLKKNIDALKGGPDATADVLASSVEKASAWVAYQKQKEDEGTKRIPQSASRGHMAPE